MKSAAFVAADRHQRRAGEGQGAGAGVLDREGARDGAGGDVGTAEVGEVRGRGRGVAVGDRDRVADKVDFTDARDGVGDLVGVPALVPEGVVRGHGEEIALPLRQPRDGVRQNVADVDRSPVRSGGRPGIDLVPGHVGFRVRIPGQNDLPRHGLTGAHADEATQARSRPRPRSARFVQVSCR